MSVCIRSQGRGGLAAGLFAVAAVFVAGAVGAGVVLGRSVVEDRVTVAEAVTQTAVLEDSDWLSDAYWKRRRTKKLRTRSFSPGRSDLGLRNAFTEARRVEKAPSKERRRTVFDDGGPYRTVCVRLCDGYYFPISSSTTKNRFAKDERACKSRCSGDSRLFYYSVFEGSPETMKDRRGRPYEKLKTAFLYRTSYNKSCQCRPDPWSDKAKERHALYKTKGWRRKLRRLARKEARRARIAARRGPSPFITRVRSGGGVVAKVASQTQNSSSRRAVSVKRSSRRTASRRRRFSGRMSLGNGSRATFRPARRAQVRRVRRRSNWQTNAFKSQD